MRDGFIKVAAATPKLRVADCEYNQTEIIKLINEADEKNVKVLVFPELCITGYTCGDLFFQDLLLTKSEEALGSILEATKHMEMVIVLGMPLMVANSLYNVAVFCQAGEILMVIPKKMLPNYQEFYEARYFSEGVENPYE